MTRLYLPASKDFSKYTKNYFTLAVKQLRAAYVPTTYFHIVKKNYQTQQVFFVFVIAFFLSQIIHKKSEFICSLGM